MGSCYTTQGLKTVLCDNLKGWDRVEGKEGGSRGRSHIYILMADSHCCMAETSTTL